MTSTNLMLKLNNYDYSPDVVSSVIEWIENGKPIKGIKKRFRDKWNNFIVKDDRLYYKPLNLLVVYDDEKEKVLKELYSQLTSAGLGISKFYHLVCSKYIGIKRSEIAYFLINQQPYQLSRPFKHHVNKPILAKYPNERWAIDLIDMNKYVNFNNKYRYILSCEDYFSKKIWLRALIQKTSREVSNDMKSIFEETGITPKIIMKDNGKEFQGMLNTLLNEHHVKRINTLSYSPESNGMIEAMNNQIRRILREIAIRTNSLMWYDKLKAVCDNKNNQKSSTTKYRPNQLWTPTNENVIDVSESNNETPQEVVAKRIKNLASKKLDEEHEIFKVGDHVRVKTSALYSQVRKMIKDKNKKYVIVSYSPEIFKIKTIFNKDTPDDFENDKVIKYENTRYTLERLDGTSLLTQRKMNNPNVVRKEKRFFANDLLKVEPLKENEESILTSKQALKLNNIDAFDENKVKKSKVIKTVKKKSIIKESIPEPITEQRNRKNVQTLNISKDYNKKAITKKPTIDDYKYLIGKVFTDEDGTFYIKSVFEDKSKEFKLKYNTNETLFANVSKLNKFGIPVKKEEMDEIQYILKQPIEDFKEVVVRRSSRNK